MGHVMSIFLPFYVWNVLEKLPFPPFSLYSQKKDVVLQNSTTERAGEYETCEA